MKTSVIKQNVGLDISKDDFKVNLRLLKSDQSLAIKGSRAFKNTLSGFKEFIKWVDKRADTKVEI